MTEYNNLIEKYRCLNIKDKREEIIEELKELLVICSILMKEKGIVDIPLLHPNMNDSEIGIEDNFLDSTYAYLISIKENIGKYFN